MTAIVVGSTFSQTKVSISGTVKDKSGQPVDNAVVRLESLGNVSITDNQGNFKIDNTSPVLPRMLKQEGISIPFIKSNIAFFKTEAPSRLLFKVYSLQGRLCKSIDAGEVSRGSYSVNLQSLLSGNLGSGTFIVKGLLGKQQFSASLTKTSSKAVPFAVQSIGSFSIMKKAAQTGIVDRLIITKLGMAPMTINLSSYETAVGTIEVTESFDLNQAQVISRVEDSLIQLLIKRIEKIDSIEGPDDLKAIDYISIRSGFEVLLGIDSTRFKSNVGLMVSSIMSLNTSQKIWQLVDSMEAYVEDVDDYYNNDPVEPQNGLLKKAMKKGGVLSLGKVMVAQTPEILTGMVQKPSFPRFITLSYIQGTIESELLPILDKVISISGRIEGLQTDAMKIDVDGDQYELDKGEIYLFDAYMHLLRAYARMYCTYNMDLYTSPLDMSYSWIDSMMIDDNDNDMKNIAKVKGDTLFHIYRYDDSKMLTTMFKTVKYNLEQRPQFMTIRKQNHEGVLADLRIVPQKVKTGMISIRTETDDQDDDLLKISDLLSNDEDMLDFSQELIDEGLSQSFSQNFSSVEKLADFITKLLSGPYTFDETIDEKKITMTINLSSFFTNPVTDLRTLLPKYTWVDDANWKTTDVRQDEYEYYSYTTRWNTSTQKYDTLSYIYQYDDDSMVIDPSIVDSIVHLSWSTYYYISQPIRHSVTIDSTYSIEPIRLVDDNGKQITYDEIDDLVDSKTFFPYFKDYTLNGLFPDMTRQKWLDLIYDK
jgi:hypothetical protein